MNWLQRIDLDPDSDAVFCDGFDDALIGTCERFGMPAVLAYDRAKIIAILMQEMREEEAEEYFQYNVIGAWAGDHTPVFITIEKGRC